MWAWIVIGTGAPVAVAVGLVVGGVLAHADGRRDALGVGADAALTHRARVAALVTLAGWFATLVLAVLLVGRFQWWPVLLPVAAAVVAAVVIVSAPQSPRPADVRPVLDLRRRGLLTFAARAEVIALATVVALLALTVVAAGSLSARDDTGRWAIVELPVGDATASTEFFGWYYGIPVLVGAVVLVAVTAIGLARTARAPRVLQARAADDLGRRLRSSALLRSATAALLVTLGSAWRLISAASQLRTEVPRTSAGTIEFGTSFAAIGPVGDLLAHCVVGLGIGLLVAQLLRGRSRRAPAPTRLASRSARV